MNGFEMPSRAALIVVDMQPDFMPGGALPVDGADEIIDGVNKCIDLFAKSMGTIVFTQDWHPPGHASFASTHPGKQPGDTIDGVEGIGPVLWPDHCVQGTSGSHIHERMHLDKARAIIRKGHNLAVDSYSAFMENDQATRTGLAGFLRDLDIERLVVCGLAYDYCVFYTAIDGVASGFEVTVLEDLSRPVDAPEGRLQRVVTDMTGKGCKIARFSS